MTEVLFGSFTLFQGLVEASTRKVAPDCGNSPRREISSLELPSSPLAHLAKQEMRSSNRREKVERGREADISGAKVAVCCA